MPSFVEDPDPLTWWRACEIENHPPSPLSPRSGSSLCTWVCVEKERREGGMPSSLLITILCDSLSWFVTVARLKERLGDEDGASVGAPRCDEDEETNRERERKKDRRFKIGAEASYLLERNIFLPCFARCGKRSATLSPRFIRSSGGTIDGSAISKLPIIREIGRLASLSFSVFSMDQLLRATKTIYDHHISS